MVFLTSDIFVVEHAFAAIELGLGDIGDPLTIDQGYVVTVSAPCQQSGGKEPRQEPGSLALKKGLGEMGTHHGTLLFNSHNRLGCF
jgi:hypothetical protein